MSIEHIEKSYNEIINKEKENIHSLQKKILIVACLRMSCILLGIIFCYRFWENTYLTFTLFLFFLISFILLLKVHEKLFYKKKYSLALIHLAENELKGLNNNFSSFDGAPEEINPEHSFSFDLDIFGDQSLFQSINRTIDSLGKNILIEYFVTPSTNKDEIINRQKAIQELKNKPKLMNHFRVSGTIDKKEDICIEKFSKSFKPNQIYFHKNKLWSLFIYLVPITYLIGLILALTGIISSYWLGLLWIITFTISTLQIKTVNKILDIFDKKTDVLSSYSYLFKIIEDENFASELLKTNQNLLLVHKEKASRIIYKLSRYCSNLNMGLAYPIVLFFNPVFLWNVRYAYLIEKWLTNYHSSIFPWMQALGRFDAFVSLGTFSYNHPEYIIPNPTNEQFILEGKEIGHPLLSRNTCVKNNITINKKSFFMVITGANMAGKSTYLRTIGTNYLLACLGAPVYAEDFLFTPSNLVTNLRTSDSLVNNESYFFSELKRLKMIIDRLKSGEHLFIILDEILKGTNSEDKQKGSIALLQQLIHLKSNGMIATHDLELGKLEVQYPSHIENYCFESHIIDNKLSFSYKMQRGIAENMNATFLMKQMGITGL